MVLLSVAGACSRSGKTALAVSLLQAVPAHTAVAVKFTTTEDIFERCPRGSACTVCNIEVPYRIITDPAVLREPATDTDRLAAAGARQVIWAITRQGAARTAWENVLAATAQASLVVMEGSTIVEFAKPDVVLFVAHPFLEVARWKPTSAVLLEQADLVVVNRPRGEQRMPSPSVRAEIESHRGRDYRVADVTRPLGEWAPELAERLAGFGANARSGPA